MNLRTSYPYAVSIIVVSYNTRDLLRDCLKSLLAECARLPQGHAAEVLVVDNASSDGSPEMVAREFSNSRIPVRLIRSDVNLGFGAANNLALNKAQGQYPVLLNSDAFFHPGSLHHAIDHMNANPSVGVGGARQVSRDGSRQPSARSFHSIWNAVLILTGLADTFPQSRIFGAPDRKWADPLLPTETDWVPGSFLSLRREALLKAGLFDPAFFFYCEEVDLCRRIRAAGFSVFYWPDIVVTHFGGESTRKLASLNFSESGQQVVLWRMRSTLLYYRKHHGPRAHLACWLELALYKLRWLRNLRSPNPARRARSEEAKCLSRLMHQAWRETSGGRISPPHPW
jgi:GT2 family glycosyltransferase